MKSIGDSTNTVQKGIVNYYFIDLYDAFAKRHDGVVDGRQVQIKVIQRDDIMISAEPLSRYT